jgi:hypothetical protein
MIGPACLVLSLLALLVCLVLSLLALLDYIACIAIATNASIVEMIGPACLANPKFACFTGTMTSTKVQKNTPEELPRGAVSDTQITCFTSAKKQVI